MNIKKKNTFPFDLEIILGEERGKYIDFSIPIYQVFKGWDRLLPYLREGNYFVVFESRRKRFPFLMNYSTLLIILHIEKQKKCLDSWGIIEGN